MAPTRPPTPPSDGLVDALVQNAFMTIAYLTRIAAENDVSLTQLRVLAILRDRRLRMSDLARYLGLERSTLSGLVDRAVSRGLVTRAPHETDGRAIEVTLSATGQELADRMYVVVAKALAPSTHSLSVADRLRLQRLLERLLSERLPE